jgi:hypothetical protein
MPLALHGFEETIVSGYASKHIHKNGSRRLEAAVIVGIQGLGSPVAGDMDPTDTAVSAPMSL